MRLIPRTALALAALLAGATALAQSSLLLPNNSAGSPLDTPPALVQPPAEPRTADTPQRADPEVTARDALDAAEREPRSGNQADEPARDGAARPLSSDQG